MYRIAGEIERERERLDWFISFCLTDDLRSAGGDGVGDLGCQASRAKGAFLPSHFGTADVQTQFPVIFIPVMQSEFYHRHHHCLT